MTFYDVKIKFSKLICLLLLPKVMATDDGDDSSQSGKSKSESDVQCPRRWRCPNGHRAPASTTLSRRNNARQDERTSRADSRNLLGENNGTVKAFKNI